MPSRHAGLDILRGVSILLVLVYHLPGPVSTWPWLLSPIKRGGWCAVDLFFALSGFLVGGLLLRGYPDDVHIGRFLIRRGLKIYPAFYAMVAALAIGCLAQHRSFPAKQWLSEVTFLQSYWPAVNGPSWSLAVEEHFYLLMAAVTALMGRWRLPLRGFVWLAIIAGVLAIGLRADEVTRMPPPFPFRTHLRLDSLLWGVMLAAIYRQVGAARLTRWAAAHRRTLVLVAGVLSLPPFIWSLDTAGIFIVGLTVMSFAGLAWILVFLPYAAATNSLAAALARIGRDSYSIYLWHGVVNLLGRAVDFRLDPFDWRWAILIPISIAIGMAMSAALELPVLAWRDRRYPSSSIGAARSAATGAAFGLSG